MPHKTGEIHREIQGVTAHRRETQVRKPPGETVLGQENLNGFGQIAGGSVWTTLGEKNSRETQSWGSYDIHSIVRSKRITSGPVKVNWVQNVASSSSTPREFHGRGHNSFTKWNWEQNFPR